MASMPPSTGARQRRPQNSSQLSNGSAVKPPIPERSGHPMGEPRHGMPMQALRIVAFTFYFFGACFFIHGSQLLGLPIWLVSRDWYRAWVAVTKQYFGILITTMTRLWSPTVVRISGDNSVAGQLKQGRDGQVRLHFPERVICIANHQLYTDWLYLWWAAYTNDPTMHGHIYIILKESLKWVPLIGPAMILYDFIYMARKWSKDEARMRYHLHQLNERHSGPLAVSSTGGKQLDPMWLLLFPEGTNLSKDTRRESAEFSEKRKFPDFRHVIIPRTKGFQLCLQELRGSVEWIYDCTIAYEGVPPGGYGSEIFTLRSVYFQGRPPTSVNMHWRRFRIADLPVDDHDAMFTWIMDRWREKDDLIEAFMREGKFPANTAAVHIEDGPVDELKTPYINAQVQSRNQFEFLQIFTPVFAAALISRTAVQFVDKVFGTQPLF